VTYLDGFVIPVPRANRDKFIAHAREADPVFEEAGATQIFECWGADVKRGHTTDFLGAVDAKDDEEIVFSWIAWPDKATRDAAFAKMMDPATMDPRMDPEKNPMPFDGKRMIFGGFEPIVAHGNPGAGEYVQGFIVPVRKDKKEAYRKMADEAWSMFQGYGATSVVEAWAEDVPEGKQTDFYRSVKAEPGETVVFSYMTWPSREVCDAAGEKMQNDPNMQMPDDMPFDGKRMVYGGFEPVVVLGSGQ
jgi:uncharacterized protein YbaA (DUF1428 family)